MSRLKRITRLPRNYTREQKIDNKQRKIRFQQKKRIESESQSDIAISDDSATENDDLDISNLVKKLVKFRQEIRQQKKLHRAKLQKTPKIFQKNQKQFGIVFADIRYKYRF